MCSFVRQQYQLKPLTPPNSPGTQPEGSCQDCLGGGALCIVKPVPLNTRNQSLACEHRSARDCIEARCSISRYQEASPAPSEAHQPSSEPALSPRHQCLLAAAATVPQPRVQGCARPVPDLAHLSCCPALRHPPTPLQQPATPTGA